MTGNAACRVAAMAAALFWLIAAGPATAAAPESCNGEPVVTAKIACFSDAAVAAGDPTVCEAAADATVRFQCLSLYAERARDPAPCGRVDAGSSAAETQVLRQACVAGVAIESGDPALCEEVDGGLRDACLTMMVTEAGADPALCARVDNEVMREACEGPEAP